jgi:DNA-binding Lrp family transcriptional regulator
MPGKNSFQFAERDIEILHHVHQLRLAHITHIALLTGRSEKALARRLLKLQVHGYLSRITRRPEKLLYVVGGQGLAVLVETGFAPEEVLNHRPRHSELKEIWLKHFLLVVDVHVRLILGSRTGSTRIIQWKEGQALWDRVTFREQGADVTLPVRPDAFFALRDVSRPEGKNTLYFFLEADRSTMAHSRMESKLKAYVQYFQKGLHTRKHVGVKLFQVLTITETPQRAQSLAAAMKEVIPAQAQRWYHFMPLSKLSLEALLPAAAPTHSNT